jgi:spore maturation protein CgeB
MTEKLPRRVLIVGTSHQPPIMAALSTAFAKLGVESRRLYSQTCNTLYDRVIIHTLNHYAHTLRLVPKSVDLFEGHPKSHREYRNRKLLELAREWQPDLVFLIRGLRFKLETLEELRARTMLFGWFTESEKRLNELEPELPYYHRTYFFSSQGVKWARDLGFANTELLQHAVDTSSFHPLDLPKLYDWSFVGQWHSRRQEYIEGLAAVSKNFVIYGPRWLKRNWRFPSLWLHIKGSGLWGEQLTRLYNQTKVVVNISVWGDERQGGSGVNMRLLEVPACKTCLLTDYTSDAELLLTPGEEFASAASLPEMQAKLAELLADDRKRNDIAAAGYQKASKTRSYDDLVAQICTDWAGLRGKI